jgi:acetyltransferase-like isoleucine patch superfamily enzyme
LHILSNIKSYLRHIWLKRKFPTSVIHCGVNLDHHSEMGIYCVLFKDVTLINTKLGAYTYIQKGSSVLNAELGKFCSVAGGVEIGLPQHSITGASSHPIFYLKNTPLPKVFSHKDFHITTNKTYIGHDVWIGKNAMVMSGVNVGVGAVIGAGAVVTKDIPAYAVVGGIPARIIKYRFTKTIRSELSTSQWWNLKDEWLEANYHLFMNPRDLLAAIDKMRNSKKKLQRMY